MGEKMEARCEMNSNFDRRRFLGTLVWGVLVQGCGGGTSTKSENSSAPIVLPEGPTDVSVPSLAELSRTTIYIAHRGSAALYPEETFVSYDKSLEHGQVLLECDVRSLRDGSLVLMHDETVGRTTNSGGLVSGFSQSEIRNLKVDANSWHGSNFGNDLKVPMFSEWVARYKSKSILVPEDKDFLSMSSMLSVFASERVSKDHVLLQSFTIAPLKQAVAQGYQACFLDLGHSAPSLIAGTGIKWAGISSNASDAELQNWIATGANVLIWTVNRRYERDAKLRFPIKGFFSDDPMYVSQNAAQMTQDGFALKTWLPGMLASNGDLDAVSRGRFFPEAYWGYDQTATTYMGCLQGYLCPVKGAAGMGAYEFNLSVTFDAAANNDATRWASVFIGVDDRAFTDRSESASGHHILFRKNGTMEIYKKEAGKTAVRIAGIGGNAIADGEEVRYRVFVTEMGITAVRSTVLGIEQYRVSAQDVSAKGAYLQLGRNGLACRFRQLNIA